MATIVNIDLKSIVIEGDSFSGTLGYLLGFRKLRLIELNRSLWCWKACFIFTGGGGLYMLQLHLLIR